MRRSTPTIGGLGHLGNTGSPITYAETDDETGDQAQA